MTDRCAGRVSVNTTTHFFARDNCPACRSSAGAASRTTLASTLTLQVLARATGRLRHAQPARLLRRQAHARRPTQRRPGCQKSPHQRRLCPRVSSARLDRPWPHPRLVCHRSQRRGADHRPGTMPVPADFVTRVTDPGRRALRLGLPVRTGATGDIRPTTDADAKHRTHTPAPPEIKPARREAVDLWEQHPKIARRLLRERPQIDRVFGTLSSTRGGLAPLPGWVRRLDRVRRWVGVKIIIHNARHLLRQANKN